MQSESLLCLILVVVFLSIFLYLLYRIMMNNYEMKISEYGVRLQMMKNINSQYRFYDLQPEYVYHIRVDTRRKCEKFDLDAHFAIAIINDLERITKVIEEAGYNNRLLQNYQTQLRWNVPSSATQDDAKLLSIPYKAYNSIENRLLSAYMLDPVTSPVFKCRVVYDSPAGRSHAEKSRCYSVDEFVYVVNQAIENDRKRSSIENLRKMERSKMSNSIRYDVLQRDGFRCRICGRTSDDGVKLHVDHIIPVAKGGKTEMENLRTLCDMCNLGKRDKYDFSGIN